MYKRMVIDFGIDESVAAFACLQTNFRDMNSALEFLFDPFEHTASGKMIQPHPFIGYDPSLPNTPMKSSYVDDENPKRSGNLICFLCQGTPSQHLMPEDIVQAKLKREKDDADANALDIPDD